MHRLIAFVHRPITFALPVAAFVLTVALGLAAGPALAQSDEDVPAAPAIEVTAGLGGFVAAQEPVVVTTSVSTPLLVSGRIRVRGGGISVSRPVEVPAGSTQSYELTVPPLADSTRLVVELLDGDGEVVVSETVSVRSNADELAVGVMGEEDLAATLGRVRTIVTDRPVAALDVPDDLSLGAFDALDYLVLLPEADGRLADATRWASGGGHLVVDAGLGDRIDSAVTPLPTGVTGVSSARIGNGRLIVVESITGRSSDEWAAILRPVPLDLSTSAEMGMDPSQNSLIQSASEAGARQVPTLPWLLFAILGFAVVVGPVNFIVLSRLGKRDLAWLTIPVCAVVAVVGFWVAGRQRLAGTTVAHASIVVADGTTESRSGVLVSAGAGGSREIEFPADAVVYPEPAGFFTQSAELELVTPVTARLELDQLEFAGVGVRSQRPDVEVPTVTVDGETVTVRNDTGIDFWAWGLTRGTSSIVADGTLVPGGSGDVGMPVGRGEMGFGFVDAVMNQHQLWDDPRRANGLWSLASALTASLERSGLYFVGLTDEYAPDISVDGAPAQPTGMSVVAVRVGDPSDPLAGVRVARAEVVGTGFINWIDWGAQRTVATDEMTVGFTLPDPTVAPTFRDSVAFGVAPVRYEAWSWDGGEFVEIGAGERLADRFVASDGDVFVRLVGQEFGESPFSPDSLTLEWGA